MSNGSIMLYRVIAAALLILVAPLCGRSSAAEPTSQPAVSGDAAAILPPLSSRFAAQADGQVTSETPDFQRHIGPLLGRLGCNGRACHGSFQGRGGFQLSLFGYDFEADHAALLDEDAGRVDTTDVEESLILTKPVDAELHEGGKRMDAGSWQHQVLRSWIAAGAPFSKKLQTLERLEVLPNEILFDSSGDQVALRAIAHWENGSAEDVTELCRFTSNDEAVAEIDEHGKVKSSGPGDTHVVVAYDKAVVPVAVLRPNDVLPGGIVAPRESSHPIDQWVLHKLDKLKIVPSELCSDSDFIRRATVDVTGLLPSPQRVLEFVADSSADKRARLIDELLEQPAYASWWATRLSDWTGNNEAQLNNYFPVRGVASQAWHAWLEKRIAENVSYDDIVEGLVVAESRLPGESYTDYCKTMSDACRSGDEATFATRPGLPQYWARNNFRQPEERAVGFAYTFLGIRIQCAQCHKHPFDQWSKNDFDKFAVLFSSVLATPNNVANDARDERDQMIAAVTGGQTLRGGDLRRKINQAVQDGEVVPFPELVVREGVLARGKKDAKNKKQKPTFVSGHILGELESISLQDDPRDSLMRWLRQPNNPYFAKAIVNRVWSNYFGIGIVNPTDDMNLGNPPSNAALLDYLAEEFVRSGYDLKSLHRTILTSDTYQRSSQPNVTNASDQRNFSRHVPRRLPAEVIRDAVYLATANDEDAEKSRASLDNLAIAGRVGSAYSRPNARDFALQVFGESIRETNCDCDRSDQSNLLQSIYLQNDVDMHRRLTQSSGWVAKTSVALTGKPLRQLAGGDDAANQKSIDAIKKQLTRRAEKYRSLSGKAQKQMKPQLEKDLRQANQRLAKLGAEKISLASLIAPAGNASDGDRGGSDGAAEVAKVVPEAQFKNWVTSAYLRVLSRTPDEDELQTAVSFITESRQPGEGLESVMWTLLNTKEFILSH
ncbi:MAG: DUF1549 and DUF1553 domain-containing protein [Planctomycetaceae bacterium]